MPSIFSKVKGYARDFKNYVKEHPVKGGILIGLAVVGIAAIVVASVFTGGGAAIAAGGLAATFGGISTMAGGIAIGAGTTIVSGAMLAYDIKRSTELTRERARVENLIQKGQAKPTSEQKTSETDAQKATTMPQQPAPTTPKQETKSSATWEKKPAAETHGRETLHKVNSTSKPNEHYKEVMKEMREKIAQQDESLSTSTSRRL